RRGKVSRAVRRRSFGAPPLIYTGKIPAGRNRSTFSIVHNEEKCGRPTAEGLAENPPLGDLRRPSANLVRMGGSVEPPSGAGPSQRAISRQHLPAGRPCAMCDKVEPRSVLRSIGGTVETVVPMSK
ncbi:unnamed protein product, partial [Nesidiocoris tenuis]